MAFRVVLVGGESEQLNKLRASIDDLPWLPMVLGEDFTADSQEEVDALFKLKKPSVVVSFDAISKLGQSGCSAQLSNVVDACNTASVPIIHLSSYQALSEVDESRGIGEHDLEASAITAETTELVVARAVKHIILRRSWLLDGDADDALLARLVPILLSNGEIAVSDHHFGSPVTMQFIDDVIVAVIQQLLSGAENWGVYHLHSADTCSEAEFCDHLIRQLKKEVDVDVKAPSIAPKGDDRRFLGGCGKLTGRKITDKFGIQLPTWRRGFGRALRAWLVENT